MKTPHDPLVAPIGTITIDQKLLQVIQIPHPLLFVPEILHDGPNSRIILVVYLRKGAVDVSHVFGPNHVDVLTFFEVGANDVPEGKVADGPSQSGMAFGEDNLI